MSDLTWTNSTRKLSDLVPWTRNPRQIKDADAARLAESLDQFGQIHAIAIGPGDEILDGHQRSNVWAACVRYGPEYEVDVRVSSRALTEAEREKLVVFLHSGATGSWDWEQLSAWEPAVLKGWGLDEGQLRGWNDDAANLALMLEAEEEEPQEDPGAQVDRAEELREKWGVNLGDLWKCGEHLIICGDCTDAAVVERVMGGEKEAFMLTDPPYCSGGFQESGRSSGSVGTDAVHKKIASDTLSTRGYIALMKTMLNTSGVLACYIFTDWRMWVNLFDAVESCGFGVRQMIVWDKGTPGMGYGWRAQHELILFALKTTVVFDKHGKAFGNVIQAQRTGNELHTTQKPVELIECVLQAMKSFDVVYDPFSGSGTTLIACERLGRKCMSVEVDPQYVAVTLERWAEMTNGTPELMG